MPPAVSQDQVLPGSQDHKSTGGREQSGSNALPRDYFSLPSIAIVFSVVSSIVLAYSAGAKMTELIHGVFTEFQSLSLVDCGYVLASVIELWVAFIGLLLPGRIVSLRIKYALWSVLSIAALGFTVYGADACNCFGSASVSPIRMLLFDVTFVAIFASLLREFPFVSLLRYSNKLTAVMSRNPLLSASWIVGRGAVLVVLAVGLFSFIQSAVRKETPSVKLKSVSSEKLDKGWMFEVKATNQSLDKISLIGFKASCRCVSAPDLPLDIPPLQSISTFIVVDDDRLEFKHSAAFIVNLGAKLTHRIALRR